MNQPNKNKVVDQAIQRIVAAMGDWLLSPETTPLRSRRWRKDFQAISQEVLPFLNSRQLVLALGIQGDARFRAVFARAEELSNLPEAPEDWGLPGAVGATPQEAILLAAARALS